MEKASKDTLPQVAATLAAALLRESPVRYGTDPTSAAALFYEVLEALTSEESESKFQTFFV